MKTKTPPQTFARRILTGSIATVCAAALLATHSAYAGNLYWDSNGTGTAGAGATPTGTWGTDTFWTTDSTGANVGSPTLTATTTILDDVFFSAGSDAVNPFAISLNSATQNARLVTFEEGTATLNTGTLSLANGGGLTLASTTVTGATISSNLTISGRQTFTVAAGRTLTLNTGTFTRNAGAVLNVLNTGTVTTTMTNLASGSLVNNLIGPWASFNTGASTTYATINGSNNIVGLGYTGGADGVAPGAASIVTDTTGALNYSVNTATGTFGTNASINTLRYTAAASTLTTATSFTTNGIMNAGSGTLTISGDITIGSTKELVLNTASNNITISNVIANNGGGASALIVTGTGTTTLNSLANTYSGGTVVNQGTLTTIAGSGNNTDRSFGNASSTVTINSGATLSLQRTYVANALAMNNATLTSGNSFSATLAGGVTLTGANTFSISGGLTIASNFTGTGTLTKTLSSTVLFPSGTNYNAGALTINGGTLAFANAASLFGGTSATWTPANITVGSGAALVLQYGGIGFNSGQTDSIISNLTAVSNNGLQAGSFIGFDLTNGNATYSSAITDSTGTGGGAVGLNKSGGNTLILGNANTFSGPVSIGGLSGQNGGTLSVSSFNSVNNGSPLLASSSLGRPTTQANGTITIGNGSNGSAHGITYTGSGETTDRVLLMSIGNGGGGLTLDQSGASGLLKFTSNLANATGQAKTITLQGSTAGTGEFAGALTDAGAVGTTALSINKAGTGTWTLSGANTYSGSTKVTAGTLIITNSTALQNSAIDTSGAGTLTFSGLTATPTIGGLAGGTALATVLGSAGVGYSNLTALTLNVVTGPQVYTGAIAAPTSGMSLTKTGAGTQTLAGANNFTSVTIAGGTLTIGNGTAGSLNGTTGTALTFTSTGGFNVAEATASTQGMGALTVNAGDATITSTASGASNAATLTFASLAARPTGATTNFVLATNTGTTNKILFTDNTNAPLNNSGSNNQGIFFGGSEYARYDATNGFRAVTYGTDSNASALQGASASGITVTTGSSADVKLTGAVTGQGTAAVNTLNLGANNLTFQATASTLSVNGILGSTGGLVNGTSASSIQTNNTGGELVIYNSGAMTIAPNIINNGGSSLTKSGAGNLTLSGTNTYTGGTVINGGTLTIATDANLGIGGGITVNGTAAINGNDQYNLVRPLTLNDGSLLTLGNGFGVTGVFSGNGTLSVTSADDFNFTNANNTFTGAISSASANNLGYGLKFNSIGDTAGAGLITLVGGSGTFHWMSASGSTTTLVNRQFAISGTGQATISGRGTTAASNLVITKDLLITGAAGAKNLRLAGSNIGNNTFAGAITDGAGSLVSLTKEEAGLWILSGSSSYNGATTITAGTLEVTSLANGGPGNTSSIGSSSNAAANLILNGGTLRYTGAAVSTDRLFSLQATSSIDASGTGAVNFTNSGAMGFNGGTAAKTLTLTGTNTGNNTLAAAIGDLTGATSLAKTSIGTWVLSGANTNTGNTTLSGGGTLVLDYTTQDNSKLSNTGALSFNTGASNVVLRGGTHTETVGSFSINGTTLGGHTAISRDGGSAKLAFGALTRGQNVGITLSLAEDSLATTSSSVVNGILTGAITVGSNWAKVDGSNNIVGLTSGDYTALTTSNTGATVNHQLTGQLAPRTVAISSNSLRIVGDGVDQVLNMGALNLQVSPLTGTLGNAAGGGILYAGGGNNNYTITGSGNMLAQNANQELIINAFQGTLNVDMILAMGTGNGGLTKTGLGALVLSKANTYSGVTRVNQGVLRLANNAAAGNVAGGVAVHSGAALELSNNITVGAEALTLTGSGISNAGALRNIANNTSSYAGAVTIGTGGARINSDSGGSLTLSGGVVTAQFNDITFGGTGNSTVSTVAISGAGNLNKDGAGTTTLSATNTYTGATNVSAGVLRYTGNSSAANGAVSVTGGALGGNGGSLGGAVTVSSTGGIDLRDGSVGNLTLGSTLAITGAAGANNLSFDLANAGSTVDSVITTGALSMTTSGAGVVSVNQLGGSANRLAAGTYDILTAASGITAGGGQFRLATTKAFGQTFSLANTTSTALKLTTTQVTGVALASTTVSNTNPSWQTPANFSGAAIADYQSNVVINSAIGTGLLDASQNINSLTYGTSATTNTVVAPGTAASGTPYNMLVIEAGSANGNTAGNGITLNNASGTHTISANIGIASSQTWTVASGATLAVSGAISDFRAGFGLTKASGGTLTLSGANTYTGATTISGGTLSVNGSLANSATTVQTGATLKGSGSILGAVTVQNGGTIATGNSIESLATGALTLDAGSTFAFELDNDAVPNLSGDLTAVTGNLTIAPTNDALLTLTELGAGSWASEKLTLISYSGTWNGGLLDYLGTDILDDSTITLGGDTWLFNYNDTTKGDNYTADATGTSFVTMTVQPVPEPHTALLAGLGLLALLRRRRG